MVLETKNIWQTRGPLWGRTRGQMDTGTVLGGKHWALEAGHKAGGGESNVLGLDLGLNTSREGKAALWDWAEQWGLVPVEEERRWSGASSKCHQEVGEGEVGWLEFFQQGQRKFNEIWVAKSLGSLSCYGTEQRASASGDAQSSLPRSGA